LKGSWEVVLSFHHVTRENIKDKIGLKCHEFLGLPLPPEGIMGGCDYLSIISQKKIFKDEISLKCPEFLGLPLSPKWKMGFCKLIHLHPIWDLFLVRVC